MPTTALPSVTSARLRGPTQSPLADELARAVRIGDWPAAYAIGEHLSVEIAVAV